MIGKEANFWKAEDKSYKVIVICVGCDYQHSED
jgi:hypothetical protein